MGNMTKKDFRETLEILERGACCDLLGCDWPGLLAACKAHGAKEDADALFGNCIDLSQNEKHDSPAANEWYDRALEASELAFTLPYRDDMPVTMPQQHYLR